MAQPVRARARTTFAGEEPSRTDIGCWFLSAAMITGGTVLLSDWPEVVPTSATLFLDVAADMGAYVVDSPDGLSVTTRSTAGALRGVHLYGDPGNVLPLLLVLAATASTSSVFDQAHADEEVISLLRSAGADIDVKDSSVSVTPSPLHGIHWSASSSGGVMAGLALSLIVDGMTVDVARLHPGLISEWHRVLHADEYLLPGSGSLPHDYLNGPPARR